MYTWGCSALEDDSNYTRSGSSCSGLTMQSFQKGSTHKKRQTSRKDSINLSRKATLPSISNQVILYVLVWLISHYFLSQIPSFFFSCSSFYTIRWLYFVVQTAAPETFHIEEAKSSILGTAPSVEGRHSVCGNQPVSSAFCWQLWERFAFFFPLRPCILGV